MSRIYSFVQTYIYYVIFVVNFIFDIVTFNTFFFAFIIPFPFYLLIVDLKCDINICSSNWKYWFIEYCDSKCTIECHCNRRLGNL